MPSVSVIIPTFDHARFIARALGSLQAQIFTDFEAIVIDDGSRDATGEMLTPFLQDARFSCHRHDHNKGLGAALNAGLNRATAPLIAYLPTDDVWHADHLGTLVAALDAEPHAHIAQSGVRYRYNRESADTVPDEPVQLVQAMHRRTDLRWVERAELTTDDLDRMFWARLRSEGRTVKTGCATCEWVVHPDQRHRLIREPIGGINPYRLRYGVTEPMIFHATTGHRIDEVTRYRAYRETPLPARPEGLKILLVGELAYNAERVLTLAERGHKLYGLWTPDAYWYNMVGPLPFGHVEELPRDGWQAAITRVKPDVIYALLNWQAIPFAHQVMRANTGVPFVWHFKEGPLIALEHGMWNELIDLHTQSDACIYSSVEMRDWFAKVAPASAAMPTHILDGDLPKRDWLMVERSAKLSAEDGEVHTVVPGRPIGLHPENVAELATNGVHLHFYGEFTHGQWKGWIGRTKSLAGRFMHLHPNVDQENWVREFSRYDAGWLHFFESTNHGDMARANWDDLNIPARMATLAACGLPMIQRDNAGHVVAMQALAREHGLGIFARDFGDVARQLWHRAALADIGERVWQNREVFMFDSHVDALIAFLMQVSR